MNNNKNPTENQPSENESGTFHYNPGNQSGKPVEVVEPAEAARDEQLEQSGTFHYNPGNQSGKSAAIVRQTKDKDETAANDKRTSTEP